MWRYPFGSGGKRVTTSECLPAARSASMIWRMKLVGRVSSIAWRLPLSLLETGGQPSRSMRLAGAVGIEPTNGGVRARCLTVWRRPKTRPRRLLRPVAAVGQLSVAAGRGLEEIEVDHAAHECQAELVRMRVVEAVPGIPKRLGGGAVASDDDRARQQPAELDDAVEVR